MRFSHGYSRYDEIVEDPHFAVLSEPFKNDKDKYSFFDRRYKLLEQALVVEEHLRRIASFQAEETENDSASQQLNFIPGVNFKNKDAEALQEALFQLEEVLVELRSDVTRMPVIVEQLPIVCERLEVDERV